MNIQCDEKIPNFLGEIIFSTNETINKEIDIKIYIDKDKENCIKNIIVTVNSYNTTRKLCKLQKSSTNLCEFSCYLENDNNSEIHVINLNNKFKYCDIQLKSANSILNVCY